MCRFPLFETIAVNNGILQNIEYHQRRVDFAFLNYFDFSPSLPLSDIIRVPTEFKIGLVRCKVSYNQYQYHIEFFHYTPKKIDYFTAIEIGNIDYHFKYSDRKQFERLPLTTNSEVILVNNGFITDCTIGNLLFLQAGQWFSPEHHLLKGTQLSRLLDEKRVVLRAIRLDKLAEFEQIMMINALNPFDPQRALPIQAVHF